MFDFAKGLIERGDPLGIQYLSIKAANIPATHDPTALLYLLEQRLTVMANTNLPQAEAFYSEALTYEPLRDCYLLSPALAAALPEDFAGRANTFDRFTTRTINVYTTLLHQIQAQGLKQLAPDIEQIANQTHDPQIRSLSQSALTDLRRTR